MMSTCPPSDDPMIAALRARGSAVREVRYRANRTVLLSISSDGRTLNAHRCFRTAPGRVIQAVARWVVAPRGSSDARRAITVVRGWDGAREGLAAARAERPLRRRTAVDGPEAAPLRALFSRLNRARFGGGLPAIPLRVSHRMTRRLGSIRYAPASGADPGTGSARDGLRAERAVLEIAIAADLLLSANAGVLEDTMLHEMAHAEAWLRHGHRGHGAVWRQIATRVGCSPRARCAAPVQRRDRRRR